VTIPIQILPLEGELPQADFHWDSKTEILGSTITRQEATGSDARTLQLGGSHGSYVSLNLVDGCLAGVEIVVWPQGEIVDELGTPVAARKGQLKVSLSGLGNTSGVVDLDGPLSCTRTADESRVHVSFQRDVSTEVVALADNLLADVDEGGRLVGLWLVDVPPFPEAKETD
jgi:hypothetical protein